MTTKVVVLSPAPNHRPVKMTVQELWADGAWHEVESHVINDGHWVERYVYGTRRILLEEVPEDSGGG